MLKLFVVRCAKNDPSSFLNFLAHVNRFIAAERGKVPELFEVWTFAVDIERIAELIPRTDRASN